MNETRDTHGRDVWEAPRIEQLDVRDTAMPPIPKVSSSTFESPTDGGSYIYYAPS